MPFFFFFNARAKLNNPSGVSLCVWLYFCGWSPWEASAAPGGDCLCSRGKQTSCSGCSCAGMSCPGPIAPSPMCRFLWPCAKPVGELTQQISNLAPESLQELAAALAHRGGSVKAAELWYHGERAGRGERTTLIPAPSVVGGWAQWSWKCSVGTWLCLVWFNLA